jgi:hypothetical protein
MKCIIYLLILVFFISCDQALLPTESSSIESATTFQISNNLKLYPAVEYIDGSLWEVIVYYYIGQDLIKVDSLSPVLTGTISSKIAVPSTYEKFKYSFQLAPKKSQYYSGCANCRRYSENFTLFEKNNNTVVEIHDLSTITLSK